MEILLIIGFGILLWFSINGGTDWFAAAIIGLALMLAFLPLTSEAVLNLIMYTISSPFAILGIVIYGLALMMRKPSPKK